MLHILEEFSLMAKMNLFDPKTPEMLAKELANEFPRLKWELEHPPKHPDYMYGDKEKSPKPHIFQLVVH